LLLNDQGTADVMKLLLKVADSDQNGQVDRREIRQMFRVVDRDASGGITVTELKTWQSAPVPPAVAAAAEEEVAPTGGEVPKANDADLADDNFISMILTPMLESIGVHDGLEVLTGDHANHISQTEFDTFLQGLVKGADERFGGSKLLFEQIRTSLAE